MRVRVTSSAEKLAELAEAEFRRLPAEMLAVAEAGAKELRDNDPYQNRTGNLRRGTQALLVVTGGEVRVDLEMDESYASFVAKRGYSHFARVSKATKLAMDRLVKRVARKLGAKVA